MKLSLPPRIILAALAVLVVTNVVTGFTAAHFAHAQDFSVTNRTCLLNWGSIGGQFEAAAEAHMPHPHPQTEAQVYHMHEDNARFEVHYPKYSKRIGLDQDKPLTLFCWAVAASDYRSRNVDIPVDPLVWQAFLAHGPKSLPLYWDLREELTEAGAGQGLIHGTDSMRLHSNPKPPAYKMGRVSTPYQPLPGEDVPL